MEKMISKYMFWSSWGMACLLISVFFTSLSSCEKYSYEPPGIDNEKVYSFSADIEPIFKNCAGCHPAVSQPDLSPGNAFESLNSGGYINTSKPEESKLLKKLQGGHAGVNSTSPKYIEIFGWMSQGAKNN